MTRFTEMTETEIQVAIDGFRGRLMAAWNRGEAGSSIVLYDLARATAEAEARGYRPRAWSDPNQLPIPFPVAIEH